MECVYVSVSEVVECEGEDEDDGIFEVGFWWCKR